MSSLLGKPRRSLPINTRGVPNTGAAFTNTWRPGFTTGSRWQHQRMIDFSVDAVAHDQVFSTPNGARLRYPRTPISFTWTACHHPARALLHTAAVKAELLNKGTR